MSSLISFGLLPSCAAATMSVSELDGLDQNGQNGAVYRSDSSLTLTNTNSSPYQATPTPFSSDSDAISIRKQKKEATRQQGQAQLQATESEAGSHIEVALGTMSSEKSRGTVQRYLYQELDASYMSFVIILCFFISGLIDSVAFNSWNCFVDMQTGKMIFSTKSLISEHLDLLLFLPVFHFRFARI